jgi:hypothetical protein
MGACRHQLNRALRAGRDPDGDGERDLDRDRDRDLDRDLDRDRDRDRDRRRRRPEVGNEECGGRGVTARGKRNREIGQQGRRAAMGGRGVSGVGRRWAPFG